MPNYEYRAKNMQGETIKGRLDAVDESAVIENLRQKNYYPTWIREYKESLNIEIDFLSKVKLKDIAIFCRQFYFILSAGISILRALEIARTQTENKKLKKILNKVFDDVQRGQTLSESLSTHKEIPPMLINMIEVGETSGTLEQIMERMAVYYDKEHRQQQKVKQALTYPAIISIFAFVVVLVLVVKVLPTFTGMIMQSSQNAVLPLPTRIVMGISDFIIAKWWLLLIIIAALVTLIGMFLKSDKGNYIFDKIKIKIPIFGKIYSKVISSRFARTFGTLMGSGVSLMQSMDICSEVVGNAVFKEALKSTKEQLERGTSLGEILEKKKLFPTMLTQMIAIGEESGTLDMILEKTSDFYDGEVEVVTAQLTTMIEPLIIIILSAVVGFIVVSIILPIFQMYNTVGG